MGLSCFLLPTGVCSMADEASIMLTFDCRFFLFHIFVSVALSEEIFSSIGVFIREPVEEGVLTKLFLAFSVLTGLCVNDAAARTETRLKLDLSFNYVNCLLKFDLLEPGDNGSTILPVLLSEPFPSVYCRR